MARQRSYLPSVTRAPRTPLPRALAIGQGAFYVATGVWPLISIGSFERVTGPKVERWLVRTVGLLVTVIGAVLLHDGLRDDGRPDAMLAAGSAVSLAAVDVVYVARSRIAPVYLLDALAEVALAVGWLVAVSARTGRTIPLDV